MIDDAEFYALRLCGIMTIRGVQPSAQNFNNSDKKVSQPLIEFNRGVPPESVSDVRTPVENHICEEGTCQQNTGDSKEGCLQFFSASTTIASAFATQSLADKKNDPKTTTPIKHLVIIFGENISFDHYFATYPVASNTELPLFLRATIRPR